MIPAERLDEEDVEDVERKPSMWDNQVILNTFVAGTSVVCARSEWNVKAYSCRWISGCS